MDPNSTELQAEAQRVLVEFSNQECNASNLIPGRKQLRLQVPRHMPVKKVLPDYLVES